MKFYLASNYSTWPQMQGHAARLRELGHEVTSEWITGCHNLDDRAEYAAIDIRDVDAAEAVIFFSASPDGSRTRGGKHVEFGYALAKGKQIFVVGPLLNVFHHLPGIINRASFDDLLAAIGRGQ